MKCTECGGTMTAKRENYRYDASGLPVTLRNVEVHRCKACGGHEVAIARIDSLHRAIALAVASRPSRLGPREIRFLRKWLDWSGADLARHMGVDAATVSRWEDDQQPMGAVADRLLRMMAMRGEPAERFPVDRLAELGAKRSSSPRIDVRAAGGEWVVSAA
jgi:putative zinc finger/helix-turn-helix YgiT family protein